MQLTNVTFANWLRSHAHKDPQERWLRELYPWPVLAQVECDETAIGRTQHIVYDCVDFQVTLKSIRFQETHGTLKYRLLVESVGLGWHSRAYADEFDMCGSLDGAFITLFHTKKEEPLEKIARAFFQRRWNDLNQKDLQTLAVSRFLAASIASQVAEEAFQATPLTHYPKARILGGSAPILASGNDLWIGYRFSSEYAYEWARRSAGAATRIVALYFVDTKHQFKRDLPPGAVVTSLTELDSKKLAGGHEEFIRILLRNLEVPTDLPDSKLLTPIVLGHTRPPNVQLTEADVNEALAALKRRCASTAELRYQLAAAVVINAWIESERSMGFSRRKKFYAFKQSVAALAKWALDTAPTGVAVWAEQAPCSSQTPILYIRIDSVDFSFNAIPVAKQLLDSGHPQLTWSGVRLKPIAPLVLAWARESLHRGAVTGEVDSMSKFELDH